MVGDRYLSSGDLRQCIVLSRRPGLVLFREPRRHCDPSQLSDRRICCHYAVSAVFLQQRRGLHIRLHGATIRAYVPYCNFQHIPHNASSDIGRDPLRNRARYRVHHRHGRQNGDRHRDRHCLDLHDNGRHHRRHLDRRDPGRRAVRRRIHYPVRAARQHAGADRRDSG